LESNRISEITDVISSVINIPCNWNIAAGRTGFHKRAVKVFNILKKEMVKLRATREPEMEDIEKKEGQKMRWKITGVKLPGRLPEYVKNGGRRIGTTEMMPPFSAESTVSRPTWIGCWASLDNRKEENKSLNRATAIPAGGSLWLETAKDRILDYLRAAVGQQTLGEILCFVGPPG